MTKTDKKVAAIILFLIGSFFLWKSSSNKKPGSQARILAEKAFKQAQQEQSDRSSPEIMLLETDFFLFDGKNIKNCHVHSKRSNIFPRKKRTECIDIFCELTTKKNLVATIKAECADICHETKNISFQGSVLSEFEQWRLHQKNAHYNASNHQINTDETELSSTKGIDVRADRSVIDLQQKTVLLEGNVVSHFKNLKRKS